MIEFRQKEFAEYDSMRLLYTELNKDYYWRDRVRVINRSSVIPVLRGNNIIIERFVISSNYWGKDKYRMYIKIGAQAKLPDDVKLPEVIRQRKFLNAKLELKPGGGSMYQKEYSEALELEELREKLFNNNKKGNKKGNKKNNKKDNGGENYPSIKAQTYIGDKDGYDIMVDIHELIAEAIKYDKRERSLVLEFDGPADNAIRNVKYALNILPFGLNYNVYLLDA